MKPFVRDLQYAFNRYFRMSSGHVVLLGDLSYRMTQDDHVFKHEDDIKNRLHLLFNVLQRVTYYRKIDLNKQMVNTKCISVLDRFCATRDENWSSQKLGFNNHLYKAKKAHINLRNKYHRSLGLKCIHSTDKIAKGN